jgi:hypothetical protein
MVVQEALARLAADDPRLGGAGAVGGWWNRVNRPEVDLVGADRRDRPRRVAFTGTVKWRGTVPWATRTWRTTARAVALVPALAAPGGGRRRHPGHGHAGRRRIHGRRPARGLVGAFRPLQLAAGVALEEGDAVLADGLALGLGR